MIQINDYASPIQVAEEIINGTKEITLSPLMKSMRKAFVGGIMSDNDKDIVDMFELNEIKEIADYLMVYYEAHKDGD